MQDLTLDFVSEINLARCNAWHSLNDWSLSDWATATTGELGELCNVIKKLNRTRDNVFSNNNLDKTEIENKLKEEIAGTFLYLDLLAQRAGIKLSDAITYEFNRVSDRENLPFYIL